MAAEQVRENDEKLVKYAVKEESISHRLGVYLEQELGSFNVDCEYDKYGEQGRYKDTIHGRIRPDIIVHSRGNSDHNLLAIEVKKKLSPSRRDELKLRALTSDRYEAYEYTLGVFVGFVGSRQTTYKWYAGGVSVPDPTGNSGAAADR